LVTAWSNARRDDLKNYDSGAERHYQHTQGHDVDVEVPDVKTKIAEFLISDPAGRSGNENDRSAVIRSKDGTYVEAASVKTDKGGYTGKTGEFKLNTRAPRADTGGSGGGSGSGSGGSSGKVPEKKSEATDKNNAEYQKLIEEDADKKSGGKQKLKSDKPDPGTPAGGNQSAQAPADRQNDGKNSSGASAAAGKTALPSAEKGKLAAGLFRNVEKNGLRYLLKADYADPGNSTKALTEAAEQGIAAFTGAISGWNVLLNTMTETGTDGGRMRLVMAGAGLALLIFLLLTRRRRKEEEEG